MTLDGLTVHRQHISCRIFGISHRVRLHVQATGTADQNPLAISDEPGPQHRWALCSPYLCCSFCKVLATRGSPVEDGAPRLTGLLRSRLAGTLQPNDLDGGAIPVLRSRTPVGAII